MTKKLSEELNELGAHAISLSKKVQKLEGGITERTGRIYKEPEMDACVYMLYGDGNVSALIWGAGYSSLKKDLKQGSLFYDRASAEKESLKRKTIQKLRTAAYEDGWKPDRTMDMWRLEDYADEFRYCVIDVCFETSDELDGAMNSLSEEEKESLKG